MYTESVREKEGGTYGVSAFGSLTKYPKEKAVLQIYFDTDPAKRAKMTDIILNELNQFVDQGPSAENLNKVKEFMQIFSGNAVYGICVAGVHICPFPEIFTQYIYPITVGTE